LKNILKFFDAEGEKMLLLTDKLHKALTHLRYESKAYRAKNIKAAGDAIRNLDGILQRHQSFQEKIIFPFLVSHIPRHEVAIHLLEAEHEDIRENEEKLKLNLRKLTGANKNLNDGKIYERGIYLISLMQHHIDFEKRHIHKSIHEELRADEKVVIINRISGWLKRKTTQKNIKRGERHE